MENAAQALNQNPRPSLYGKNAFRANLFLPRYETTNIYEGRLDLKSGR